MRHQTFTLLAIAACLVLAGCSPFALHRHVAQWRFGPEQVTTLTADPAPAVASGGASIFDTTFNLPRNQSTVFVTLSSTGDTHGGSASWFAALLNGVPCNDGNEGAGFAPGGWVPLQKNPDGGPGGDGGGGPGDLHDNSIYYTWCCLEGAKPGGPNRVQIRMASSIAGEPVFVERSHYYVDSIGAKLCGPAGGMTGPDAAVAADRSKLPEGHQ